MKRIQLCLLFALLVPLAPRGSHAAASSRSIEAKVALESNFEKRLQAVLQKVLGTSDFVVIVNADVVTETGDDELMPGVPLKDTPSDPAEAPTRNFLKSLSAVIILDTSATDEQSALAQKTAASILAIDAKRGDRVQVEKMNLREAAAKTGAAEGAAAGSAPAPKSPVGAMVMQGLWLLTAVIGLVLLYAAFLKPLLAVARKFAAVAAAPPPAAAQAQRLPPELSQDPQIRDSPFHGNGQPDSGGTIKEDLPFSFLSDRNMPMLSFMLKRQTPRVCAVVCHYLPARMAAEILMGMKADKRAQVVQNMSRVTQLNQSEVKAIETNVREKIEYLMGGEDKLADILEQVPVQLQEELLAAVQSKDPDVGRRLGKRIVMLDDIALLDADDLKTLSRRVQLSSLAAVLKDAPGLKAKLLPKLTSGLGQWLTQEIELSQALPSDRLEAEQRKVLAALSTLVREGKITLKKTADSTGEAADLASADPQPSEPGVNAMPEPSFESPSAAAPEPSFSAQIEAAPEPSFSAPEPSFAAAAEIKAPEPEPAPAPEPLEPETRIEEPKAPPPASAPALQPRPTGARSWDQPPASRADQPPHRPRPLPVRPRFAPRTGPEGTA